MDPALLDGPVELEGPLAPLGFDRDPLLEAVTERGLDPVFDGVPDLDDTESERGGIFRARELRRDDDREQHQQAADRTAEPDGVRALRPDGARPLPRRKPPTLVTDRGRRVDEGGRAHPTAAGPEPTGGSVRPLATGPVPHEDRRRPTEPRPPTGFRPPAGPPKARRRQPAPRSSTSAVPSPSAAPDTVGGLPRRIRQASLAPQLREGSGAPGPDPVESAEDIERDADEVRNRMASLQRGWQRGRLQNAEDVTGPGDTAQGTTPGGDGP